MNIKVLVGKNIKSVRNAKSISQEKLAYSADLDRTYISSIKNDGKCRHFILIY